MRLEDSDPDFQQTFPSSSQPQFSWSVFSVLNSSALVDQSGSYANANILKQSCLATLTPALAEFWRWRYDLSALKVGG